MKQVNNNLPPNSQQWVREVEKELGRIDRLSTQYRSLVRQQNSNTSSTSNSSGALQAEINELKHWQEYEVYDFPVADVDNLQAVDTIFPEFPNPSEYSGYIDFTISPYFLREESAGGASYGGYLQVFINFENTLQIANLDLWVGADPSSTSANSTFFRMPYGEDKFPAIVSIDLISELMDDIYSSAVIKGALYIEKRLRTV